MRRILPAVLCLAVALGGCRAKEALDKAAVARDLQKRGTTDLMQEIAKDHYDAPKDGHLTDAQVQMYLKVRDHEKVIAQTAKAEAQKHADAAKAAGDKSIGGMIEGFKTMSAAAEMVTADLRAAKDLHYNTAEYQWVKGQILAASMAEFTSKASQAFTAQMDASYKQVKKQYDEAKDEQTKSMYKQMLDGMEQQRAESAKSQEQVDPAITFNRQILSKYENALKAFAHEMSKWEDKPGESQKSVDEFQKNVDKAVQDAKAQKP